MSPLWNLIDEKPYAVRPECSGAEALFLLLALAACSLFLGIVIGATFDEPVQRLLGW